LESDASSPSSDVTEEEAAAFQDAFVTFLTTYDPVHAEDEKDFVLVLTDLTHWSLANLLPDERHALADRIADESVTFAAQVAEDLAPQIIKALSE